MRIYVLSQREFLSPNNPAEMIFILDFTMQLLNPQQFQQEFPPSSIKIAATEEIKYAGEEIGLMSFEVGDCITVFAYTPNGNSWGSVFHARVEGASQNIDEFETNEETITEFLQGEVIITL
jgi:hypothetical protein